MGTPKKESSNHVQTKTNVETYGRVILTLKNCLLPDEKLSPTPSQIDGLDSETETDLRILGCELMQTAGILLKLPQVAMATAQVLFHRFYYSKSFVRQHFEITGMGCLYLASKIEEAPRRIRDVINVYHHIKQVNNQKSNHSADHSETDLSKKQRTITPMMLDQNYISLKYQVIKAERRVLKELGFCVHVKHPHKLIVLYLQVLGLETKKTLMQVAWNYMNDSLRTDVFVRYQPETVACACIYLTARKLKLPMPKTPPWFNIFSVEEKDIHDICTRILRLYARAKPKAELLEKKVQELCKKFEENRQKNKTGFSNAASGNNTPTSPSVTDKKSSPKRRSHSDRSRSRSRSASASPRHKKSKKHKRSTSRSRSRSRSYDKKYKKSHKNNRRSRSSSPTSKSYKDKRYRSRSKSYEREYPKKVSSEGKYYSDRYKEEKGYDRYYKDDKFRSKDDDKYRKDEDKYRKDEKSISKDDDRHKKEDKHKKIDDNYRKEDNYKNSDKNYDDDYKDERKIKYKSEDKYSREVKYISDKSSKNDKYDEKDRYSSDKYGSKEKHKNAKSDKYNSKDDDYVMKDDNYSSKRDKYESDRKRKSKHRSDDDEEDDDDIEIIAVKKEKKVR